MKLSGVFWLGVLTLLVILGSGGCQDKESKKETTKTAQYKNNDLQIVDISQKQLSLYNGHLETDSTQRVKIFRDSLYYPYQELWDGYLGSIETFDAVAEHYGIRTIEKLNEKNKLFYSGDANEDLLKEFYEVRDGMIELTGHSPKGKWYLHYGPAIANLGGVGKGVMFIDFSFPDNKDLPSVINWFPHELNHQIYSNLNQDTSGLALGVCIDEGFAVYVNKLYWNKIANQENYSLAKSLNYSDDELAAAKQDWEFILSYFRENYRSTEKSVKNSFGSRSSKLTEKLPGAIGYFIGYKIVESYVEQNGPQSWKDVYTLSHEELLDRSKILSH